MQAFALRGSALARASAAPATRAAAALHTSAPAAQGGADGAAAGPQRLPLPRPLPSGVFPVSVPHRRPVAVGPSAASRDPTARLPASIVSDQVYNKEASLAGNGDVYNAPRRPDGTLYDTTGGEGATLNLVEETILLAAQRAAQRKEPAVKAAMLALAARRLAHYASVGRWDASKGLAKAAAHLKAALPGLGLSTATATAVLREVLNQKFVETGDRKWAVDGVGSGVTSDAEGATRDEAGRPQPPAMFKAVRRHFAAGGAAVAAGGVLPPALEDARGRLADPATRAKLLDFMRAAARDGGAEGGSAAAVAKDAAAVARRRLASRRGVEARLESSVRNTRAAIEDAAFAAEDVDYELRRAAGDGEEERNF